MAPSRTARRRRVALKGERRERLPAHVTGNDPSEIGLTWSVDANSRSTSRLLKTHTVGTGHPSGDAELTRAPRDRLDSSKSPVLGHRRPWLSTLSLLRL